jgi:hypothetical protein
VLGLAAAIVSSKSRVDSLLDSISGAKTAVNNEGASIVSAVRSQTLSMGVAATGASLAAIDSLSDNIVMHESSLASQLEGLGNLRDGILDSVITEEAALPILQASIESSMNSGRLDLQSALNEDSLDRTALLIEDARYTGSVQSQVTGLINAFIAKESSRAVVESAHLSAALSTSMSQSNFDLSSLLAGEASHATFNAKIALNAAITKAQTSTGTSTDDQAWFVVVHSLRVCRTVWIEVLSWSHFSYLSFLLLASPPVVFHTHAPTS